MLRRRTRFSVLATLPGGLPLLARGGAVPWGAPSRIGSVAPTLMSRALAEAGLLRLDIVIFTGPALEPWNPETLRAVGMGGSESMAWELSRHLARLGHRVRVFGQCRGLEGVFEGVEWLDFTRFRGVSCDVLLSSRQPAAVDSALRLDAKLKLLWVHDVHLGKLLTPERAEKFDAILCLSAWHVVCFLTHHPEVPASKVLQTRNGIDISAFARGVREPRDAHRAIYSSSPDRGLQIALDAWHEIRAQVPGATLHVYYGFESWRDRAAAHGEVAAPAEIARMQQQIASTEGVVYHGRVSPEALAKAFWRSGVWAYPNWFHETSCITAMQAQAAGLQIVTSALAALNETVADRGALLTEDPKSAEYRRAFIAATVAAMNVSENDERRQQLQAYAAEHFALETLADEFVALFRRLLGLGSEPELAQ